MVILGLSIQAWLTILIILSVFLVLAFTNLSSDFVFLGGMFLLYLTGVLDAKEAFAGFSSNTVLVIAILFIVIAGLVNTGVLRWVVNHALGKPRSYPVAITKLMLPVATLSAFLSNTIVVALYVRVVKMWAKKLGIAPSKLLIPLSYASGMGGVCTLIGTPPNLIISDAFCTDTGIKMGFFITLVPGLFCLAVGILSMLAMRGLLPDREPGDEDQIAGSEHILQVFVTRDNPLVGKTISEAGLNNNPACRIIEITRFDNYVIDHVEDDEFIFGKDTLILAGTKSEMEAFAAEHGFKTTDSSSDYSWKTTVSAIIMAAMVILSAFNVLSLLQACILAAMATLLFRCCTVKQAKANMDWGILAIFAASMSFGAAITKTGLAEVMANGLISIFGSHPLALLIAICLASTIITEFVSNTACAAIFYPVAYKAAIMVGANPMTFAIALMIAVSSSFATPIGSPTHMLVYTPGGYRFTDFLKVGLPMNIIILAANIFIVTLLYPL